MHLILFFTKRHLSNKDKGRSYCSVILYICSGLCRLTHPAVCALLTGLALLQADWVIGLARQLNRLH